MLDRETQHLLFLAHSPEGSCIIPTDFTEIEKETVYLNFFTHTLQRAKDCFEVILITTAHPAAYFIKNAYLCARHVHSDKGQKVTKIKSLS
jgi:hypothetical protein